MAAYKEFLANGRWAHRRRNRTRQAGLNEALGFPRDHEPSRLDRPFSRQNHQKTIARSGFEGDYRRCFFLAATLEIRFVALSWRALLVSNHLSMRVPHRNDDFLNWRGGALDLSGPCNLAPIGGHIKR